MNNVSYLSKLNFIFPLELFNSNCIFYQSKCVFFKYYYKEFKYINFFNSVNSITNYYYILLKIKKSIKKSTLTYRINLSRSTRKIRQQKGLGKARLGSLKSPLLRGGATLFGPKNIKLSVFLRKKNQKLNFLYFFLNKRTQFSFMTFIPIFHQFYSIIYFMKQQQRIRGCFSQRVLYITKNVFKIKKEAGINYCFSSIHTVTLYDFLNNDHIVFLI